MNAPSSPPITLAAGGVVWRADNQGSSSVLVALVHRPRYDDWTLPKGKLTTSEYPVLGAIREVAEETGAVVAVRRRLLTVSYPVERATKRVGYWSMRYLSGEHQPNDEVDEVRWLEPAAAAAKLSYAPDRRVLETFQELPADAPMVLLVRHAKAGKRSEFRGEDRLRPLDRIGRRQARHLASVLQAFAPANVLAADLVRCEQTVQALADRLGIEVTSAPEVSDAGFAEDPNRAVKLVKELAASGGTSVVCSQGDAIPGLLTRLQIPAAPPYQSRKSSVWALSFIDDQVVAADYYPRPSA